MLFIGNVRSQIAQVTSTQIKKRAFLTPRSPFPAPPTTTTLTSDMPVFELCTHRTRSEAACTWTLSLYLRDSMLVHVGVVCLCV